MRLIAEHFDLQYPTGNPSAIAKAGSGTFLTDVCDLPVRWAILPVLRSLGNLASFFRQ